MTTIGTITVNAPNRYERIGYEVMVTALVTETQFNQMRELFSKADYGTAIYQIPGARPYGDDLTADAVNTVYCTWTHGTSSKVPNGWYLLRPTFRYVEDESAEGHSYVYAINLFFLGTDSSYSHCYGITGSGDLDNDWEI